MFLKFYCLPLTTVVVVMLLTIAGWSVAAVFLPGRLWRFLNGILAVVALCVILYGSLVHRSGNVQEVHLQPFISFQLAKVQPELYRSMLMNVAFYLPLGMTLANCWPRRWNGFLLTLLSAFLLSLCVEAAQYAFALGVCEADDVICNTLGALLGGVPYFAGKHKHRRSVTEDYGKT